MEDADIRALLWLAADDNPVIAQQAADELVELGEQVLPHIAWLSDKDQEAAVALNRRIRDRFLEDEWHRLAIDPKAERGALLIAQWADPQVDPIALIGDLDELAEPLAGRLPEKRDTGWLHEGARLLAEWLGEEQGFHGDVDSYHDPRNSFLHEVLERRQGLPILLSLLYVLIGRRAGVPTHPIGMPGHFIVRVGPAKADIFLDPFDHGRRLTREQCRNWLETNGFGWRDSFLAPVSEREIIARMLRNLINSYRQRGDEAAQQQLMRYYRIVSGKTFGAASY